MKNIHEMFNQWRSFLSSNSLLHEISQKTINQDYSSAKDFIDSFVRTDLSAFYCLNLLIENLSSYTKYLEIVNDADSEFLGFRLKKSFLYKREEELTDDNVRDFIEFTIQCIEILLKDKPFLKSENSIEGLRNKIEKERAKHGTV